MKVILPDDTELELEDGATGLDAARAIGPRLAEQAVLVRLESGETLDLRDPLQDGARIQILTTRDRDDPDALYVLRHSTAHLLAEAVQRLYPGTKIAIGPPIDDGFYYDFDFPEPITDQDLERLEDEINREIKEGRSWQRSAVDRDTARMRFETDSEPYKVELVNDAEGAITLYEQGDFVDLCRGPHLQSADPIKAVKLTSLAGAYWRGDSENTQLTRLYGTAFYSKKDLDAHLERLEQAKLRDHRRLGKQLDLFHFSDVSPGSPFWHPKGMVIWNVLEDLRRSENARAQASVRPSEQPHALASQSQLAYLVLCEPGGRPRFSSRGCGAVLGRSARRWSTGPFRIRLVRGSRWRRCFCSGSIRLSTPSSVRVSSPEHSSSLISRRRCRGHRTSWRRCSASRNSASGTSFETGSLGHPTRRGRGGSSTTSRRGRLSNISGPMLRPLGSSEVGTAVSSRFCW